MTPEQLLIPRHKCIAPLPFQPAKDMYNVGDIITDDGMIAARNQHGDPVFVVEWEKYPRLFQPLPWYADRAESDMPEYIKFVKDHMDIKAGGVYKYSDWAIDKEPFCIGFITGPGEYDKCAVPATTNAIFPATLEEYEQWKQSKNTL
jgi:hypothetical protein